MSLLSSGPSPVPISCHYYFLYHYLILCLFSSLIACASAVYKIEMNQEVELDVDEIIRALLEVRTAKPGKLVGLKEAEILGLIRVVKAIFLEQPMLL
jgi:hypothetical protein